ILSVAGSGGGSSNAEGVPKDRTLRTGTFAGAGGSVGLFAGTRFMHPAAKTTRTSDSNAFRGLMIAQDSGENGSGSSDRS
ncbi:MAG TPA: hypothetical protein VKU80_06920, partial [Planctomycetota bacterium]|nr:hypothetical protein [Planctomycetota bacterium]